MLRPRYHNVPGKNPLVHSLIGTTCQLPFASVKRGCPPKASSFIAAATYRSPASRNTASLSNDDAGDGDVTEGCDEHAANDVARTAAVTNPFMRVPEPARCVS